MLPPKTLSSFCCFKQPGWWWMLLSFLYIAAVVVGKESMWNHWGLILLFVSTATMNTACESQWGLFINQNQLKNKSIHYFRTCNGPKNKCPDLLFNQCREMKPDFLVILTCWTELHRSQRLHSTDHFRKRQTFCDQCLHPECSFSITTHCKAFVCFALKAQVRDSIHTLLTSSKKMQFYTHLGIFLEDRLALHLVLSRQVREHFFFFHSFLLLFLYYFYICDKRPCSITILLF